MKVLNQLIAHVCCSWTYIYIRSFSPQFHAQSLSQRDKLLMLTSQAGAEAVEAAQERRDEARVAMMQQSAM